MAKEQVTRFLVVAYSRTHNEVWKLPSVLEPRYCSKDERAFHCTYPINNGAFLLWMQKVKNGWKSLHPYWELRAIIELTREEYLQAIEDYVHSTKR